MMNRETGEGDYNSSKYRLILFLELAIAVTMYNVSSAKLSYGIPQKHYIGRWSAIREWLMDCKASYPTCLQCRTMHNVMSMLVKDCEPSRLILDRKHFAFVFSRKESNLGELLYYWVRQINRVKQGKDGWKKIVVCIIADGRKAVHPRVLDWYIGFDLNCTQRLNNLQSGGYGRISAWSCEKCSRAKWTTDGTLTFLLFTSSRLRIWDMDVACQSTHIRVHDSAFGITRSNV